jgi:hypothetical protein
MGKSSLHFTHTGALTVYLGGGEVPGPVFTPRKFRSPYYCCMHHTLGRILPTVIYNQGRHSGSLFTLRDTGNHILHNLGETVVVHRLDTGIVTVYFLSDSQLLILPIHTHCRRQEPSLRVHALRGRRPNLHTVLRYSTEHPSVIAARKIWKHCRVVIVLIRHSVRTCGKNKLKRGESRQRTNGCYRPLAVCKYVRRYMQAGAACVCIILFSLYQGKLTDLEREYLSMTP